MAAATMLSLAAGLAHQWPICFKAIAEAQVPICSFPSFPVSSQKEEKAQILSEGILQTTG